MNEFWKAFEERLARLQALYGELAAEVQTLDTIPDADDEYRYRIETSLAGINTAVFHHQRVIERRDVEARS